MEFRTTLNPSEFAQTIGYQSNTLLLGSCFTENIGRKLKEHSYNCLINPCGILYNPMSVANTLDILRQKQHISSADLFDYNAQWHSFAFHSRYSASTAADATQKMNKSIEQGHQYLYNTQHLIITWGTAWCYKHIETNQVVANNHKLPDSKFQRIFLQPEEIVATYKPLIKALREINPEIHIILTISPIRHLKDGHHGNQLSKSSLLLAANEIQQQFPSIDYFPAYEIQLDDLRDYRFYAADMLHPNELAIDYIWEKFSQTAIDTQEEDLQKRLYRIHQAVQHRVSNPDSEAHQRFKEKYRHQTMQLLAEYPFLKLDEALDYFS